MDLRDVITAGWRNWSITGGEQNAQASSKRRVSFSSSPVDRFLTSNSVIVVHGSGGDGAKSWFRAATEDLPESTWLRDVLLAENKDARVMLFSYPSPFKDGGDVLSTRALEEVARGLLAKYKDMSPIAGRKSEDRDPVLSQVLPPNWY